MMMGGVAFLYPWNISESNKKLLEVSGLLLILGSYLFVSSDIPWPGYFALIPVLGSYLMIVANRQSSVITNNKAFQYLGKWSYSIYLWHWPIVVFGYYLNTQSWALYGLPLSVALGFVSFKFVERFHFQSFSMWLEVFKVKPVYMVLLLGLASSLIFYMNGFTERFYGNNRVNLAMEAVGDWSYPPKGNKTINGLDLRFIEGKEDKNILFLGASHIEQLYPYVSTVKSRYNVYFLTKGGCFVTPSMSNPKWDCDNIQKYENIFDELKFDKIVTSLYCFDCYLPLHNKEQAIEKRITEFDVFLKSIKKQSKEVFLIKGEPKGRDFNPKLAVYNPKKYVLESTVRKEYKIHDYALSKLKELDNVEIIDPVDYLCLDGLCKTFDDDYKFFYKDSNHMRPWYSKEYVSYLNSVFD
jgi:hypothetical protein